MDHECRIDGLVISNLLLRLYKNPFFKTAALNLNPCFLGAGTGFDSLEAKITAVVVIILLLLFTILLLKSAISEQNPKFLLPWLVAKGISTILQVFVTPYVATLLYADKQTFLLYIFSSIIALGMLFLILHHLTVLRICICNVQMMKFVILIFTVLQSYFWLVVYSYYKELTDRTNGQRGDNTIGKLV